LDEVLGTPLTQTARPVVDIEGLSALNLDPEAAARAYREKIVGPYRGILPDASVRSIEEQLSGACTVEIAAFDEFSKLLGDAATTASFDHVVFDTAPTGHTLRLLQLPAAWSSYIEASPGGVSCLGPLAGLAAQRTLYERTRDALSDATMTRIVLVSRPEASALAEAERSRHELDGLGIQHQHLVLNGVFVAADRRDPIALAFETRGTRALSGIASGLAALPRTEFPLLPFSLVGPKALTALLEGEASLPDRTGANESSARGWPELGDLVQELAERDRGVIFTMGKGGVGKSVVALRLARALRGSGKRVHLTTTDPAASVSELLLAQEAGIEVSRIDPRAETRRYAEEVLQTVGASVDAEGRALVEEELRSPCTEEVAVFRAFARVVEQGQDGFVVIDTAPTGHTLLLLDAAEAYHREVARTSGDVPDNVRALLPRLRDPNFAKIIIVTLAEATPVHEAAALQTDLVRAGIEPFAWVINQSLLPLHVSDPILVARRAGEEPFVREVQALSSRLAVIPFAPTVGAPVHSTATPTHVLGSEAVSP
jgi:arsenite-transporting ATPase